jgi:hypothetical protein
MSHEPIVFSRFYGVRLFSSVVPVATPQGMVPLLMGSSIQYYAPSTDFRVLLNPSVPEPTLQSFEIPLYETSMAKMARLAKAARSLRADVADFHANKPIDARLVVNGVVPKERLGELEDLLQKFVGGQVRLIAGQSAEAVMAEPAVKDAALVLAGLNSQELLSQAASDGAGVIVLNEPIRPEDLGSLLSPLVFQSILQRVDKPILQLQEMWQSLGANPIDGLTPELFKKLKSVSFGATPEEYEAALVKITKIAWEASLIASRNALKFVGISA